MKRFATTSGILFIAALTAVATALLLALFGCSVRDQDRNERNLRELKEAFTAHIKDGHPRGVEAKIDGVKEALNERLRALERENFGRER